MGDGQAARDLMGHHMELDGAVELEELGVGADGDREVEEKELEGLGVGVEGDQVVGEARLVVAVSLGLVVGVLARVEVQVQEEVQEEVEAEDKATMVSSEYQCDRQDVE